MTTVAFIFARGGSKGLPRKNLRTVAGKLLLVHAIEAAQAASLVDRVVVSTEDGEIAAVARQHGAEVLDRPSELATDDAPEWLAWRHAVRSLGMGRGDLFVSVPCTAPLRIPADIDAAIRRLQQGDCDAVIIVTLAQHNPWFNQVALDLNDRCRVAFSEPRDNPYERRQDAPSVYDVTTVAYAAQPEFILRASNLWKGIVCAVTVPPERAIDIDTELDLRIAEALYGNWGEPERRVFA